MNTLIVTLTLITLYLAYRRVRYWKRLYKHWHKESKWWTESSFKEQKRALDLNCTVHPQEEIIKELQTKLKGAKEIAKYWEDLYLAKNKSKKTSKKK